MAEAGDVRNAKSEALGCNPSTGTTSAVEVSPAAGVVPTANPSDPNAAVELQAAVINDKQ